MIVLQEYLLFKTILHVEHQLKFIANRFECDTQSSVNEHPSKRFVFFLCFDHREILPTM